MFVYILSLKDKMPRFCINCSEFLHLLETKKGFGISFPEIVFLLYSPLVHNRSFDLVLIGNSVGFKSSDAACCVSCGFYGKNIILVLSTALSGLWWS